MYRHKRAAQTFIAIVIAIFIAIAIAIALWSERFTELRLSAASSGNAPTAGFMHMKRSQKL